QAGGLLAKGKLVHRYPHSWRSKAPLIFRNTSQWFISMETNNLRETALKAIAETRFVPETGRNRLHGMIAERPDWCVSRQRAWGVPITVFVHKETGEPLRDQAVLDRVAEAVEQEGADAWFASDASRFLGDDHDASDYEQVTDILDVWFDSGSTHAFCLEQREDLTTNNKRMGGPDTVMYLEGTDQHRGWFHSSLLESCGTRGRAPYEGVLTHGFVMAKDGRKMSKSLGNQMFPEKIIKQSGAEILRLWVSSSDYMDDLRIGPEILKTNTDAYRKMRNTIRFLLGNLSHYDAAQAVDLKDMPELERYMLHRLTDLDKVVREAYLTFDFKKVFSTLFNFCTLDLSNFYLDIRKDALYCEAQDSQTRQATLTVMDEMFSHLTAWLAPIMCFTMEESWLSRHPDADSVHLRQFPTVPDAWADKDLARKWRRIRKVRRVVTGALEIERREKRIGSSLEAAPIVHIEDKDLLEAFEGQNAADIFITSQAELTLEKAGDEAFRLDDVPEVSVVPAKAQGQKCARSWKILPEVGSDPDFPDLTLRDANAVRRFDELKG
ncbi:MAG: class I tRNA ligase family protein, partial [Hyphomicrobiaceae bacterium]|nr:class I tRNA ligase family protein [Hyphomicrobiaceae bacterium]